jgi:hypothetical protein
MTAQELLNMELDGNSTLFDVFDSHLIEGQFGDVEDEQKLFLEITQKIIDAVKT